MVRERVSTQAHQAEARAPGRPRRAQLCSGRGLPSTFHSAHDDLALRGGQCLHGTQSPPRVSNPGPLCSCSVSPRRRLTRPVPSSGAVPGLGRPRWASSVAVRSRRSVSARLFLSHVARLWAKRVHVRLPASPGARGAGPGSPAGARPWSFRGARAPRPPSGGRGPRPCLPAWSPLGVFELPRHAGRSPQQVP